MDELFELKRIALMEQKEYQNLLPWCRAHEKLLPRYDSFFENDAEYLAFKEQVLG